MKIKAIIGVTIAFAIMAISMSSCSSPNTIAEYSKAVDSNKRDETAWINLANAYYDSGDVAAAINTLEEALDYIDSSTIVERLKFFKENQTATTTSAVISETEISESDVTIDTTEEKTAAETTAAISESATSASSKTDSDMSENPDTVDESPNTTELELSGGLNESIYKYEKVPFSWAYASSSLTEGDIDYIPDNAINDNKNKPWVEGVSGNGIGEYIELYFDGEKTIDALSVHPGYAQLNGNTQSEIFEKNNRPKIVEFEFSDGTTAKYEFYDYNEQQKIQFNRPVTTDFVKMTILSVYQGTEYQDTCITYVTAYRSISSDDVDYNVHFDNNNVLRWNQYPNAVEYLVVADSWGDRAEDHCLSNDSVNYAYYMASESFSEGTYDLYVYAINEDMSETYLGSIEYYYAPNTKALKGRISDFWGVYRDNPDDTSYTSTSVTKYDIHFDDNGTLHWNEYDGAYDYKIICEDKSNGIWTNQLYTNSCSDYINNTLVGYADFPSEKLTINLYAILLDDSEVLIDTCEFYFSRKSDELKSTLNGTWHLAYYDDLTPEQYYNEYKDTFDQMGYDVNSCYATMYLESDENKVTVIDVRGENEYDVEFYDNGVGIVNSNGSIERLEYNSKKKSLIIESFGTKVTYMR